MTSSTGSAPNASTWSIINIMIIVTSPSQLRALDLKIVVPVVRRQLLDITHTSVHGFDFLSNAIWAEVPRQAHLPLRAPW